MQTEQEENVTKNSIHPLCEVVAGLESSGHLRRAHFGILGHVLGVLPLEVLSAILGVWCTSKVAIGCSLLILWLTQRKGHCNGTRTAIKVNLHDICDVVSCKATLLSAVGLNKERQRLGNTNRVGQLHQGALAQAALHNRLG